MAKRRVVITGLGTVNPVANNLKDTWKDILNGKSGIGNITKFDASEHKTKIGGEIKNFDFSTHLSKKEARRMDDFTVWGICAAEEAITDSGIDFSSLPEEESGVIFGTGMGGIQTFETQLEVLRVKGPKRVSPFFIPMLIPDILPGYIAIRHNLRGVNYTTVSACASSAHAVSNAFEQIANGTQTVMVTGGAEGAITPLAVAGFNSAQSISTENDNPQGASRPFDKTRTGFVMSDGAVGIVLEEYEFAKKRNAKIYAEIIGFGFSCDAFHITAPHEDAIGAAAAMNRAIKMGGIDKTQITHINAHGTSTVLNDKIETLAIKKVFQDHAKNIKVCSTKSMTGHMLGSAGAMETTFVALSLKNQIIPPTINYSTPDEDCDLDYNPNQATQFEFEYALSNSFGFGGHNASILFKKFND